MPSHGHRVASSVRSSEAKLDNELLHAIVMLYRSASPQTSAIAASTCDISNRSFGESGVGGGASAPTN